MKFQSLWAVVLRHSRLWMRDVNLIMVTLYWPLLDVLIWGFLGAWMQQVQTHGHNYELVCLMGILLWQVVARTAIWVAAAMDEEIQAQNLINLFTLPLSISEWIAGITLFSLMLTLATAFYCIGLMMFFYNIPFVKLLSMFVLFSPPLFISGVAIGFLGLQVLVTAGKRGREIMYIFSWAAAPFCSAFYPREVLPGWAQTISSVLPMSHVFEAMRAYLLKDADPSAGILKGLIMSVIYAAITIMVFAYLFNKSKEKGLARLSD